MWHRSDEMSVRVRVPRMSAAVAGGSAVVSSAEDFVRPATADASGRAPAVRPDLQSVLNSSTPEGKRHEVWGLLSLAVAAFLGLALGSFDARGGRDWGGPLGRFAAESLVALIGTASVLVPYSMLVLAVRFFSRSVRPFRLLHAAGTLAIITSIATALHLGFGERPMVGHLAPGGLVGVTLGELLRSMVGTAGADLVVMTALLVALVLRTRLSVVTVASTARHAGIKGSLVARDGIVTVARAWKQASAEELRARGQSDAASAPRLVGAEERTEVALADVLRRDHEPRVVRASGRSARDSDDSVEGGDPDDAVHGATLQALVEGMHAFSAPTDTGPLTLEPGAARKRTRKTQFDPERAGADDAAANSLSESSDAARDAIALEPDGAAGDAATPTAATEEPRELQIVSHAEEIAAALSATASSPPKSARKVRPKTRDAEPPPLGGPRVVQMPEIGLLAPTVRDAMTVDEAQLRASAERLVRSLRDFKIEGRVVEIHPGPVVTTFEFVPAAGTKLSTIARLSDDLAMSLEANRVRIVAPIPGKGRVGFEIPNPKRATVYLRELLDTEAFRSLGGALPVAIGKDVVGAPYFSDISKMPHVIVAGATGAGKSVGLNVMLTSLLFKRSPEEVRLLMIDPKMVELAVYDGIPHMLLPVVTDMKKAALALRWVVDEMERRYTLFAQTGSRNIESFNERVLRALAEGRPLQGINGPIRSKATGTTVDVTQAMEPGPDGELPPLPEAPKPQKLPYILVVVDEFADLMMVAGKEVECAVARLAQKARAAGIHVILATQRPSVDVITGVIKANFPSRVAFKVAQKVDSRTILDQQGAEHLLGRGDMLIIPPGTSELRRVHCAFVGEDEVQAVTDHWRKQGAPTYDEEILRPREEDEGDSDDAPEIRVPMEKYEKAVALVLSSRRCSVSWIQRQLAVGYNVAARMVEKMERDQIVGPPKGPGKDREVLG